MDYIRDVARMAWGVITDYSAPGFWLFWIASLISAAEQSLARRRAAREEAARSAAGPRTEKEVFGKRID